MKTIQIPVTTYKTIIVNNMDSLNAKFDSVMSLTYSPYKRQRILKIRELLKNFTGINNTYLFIYYVKRAYVSMMRLACGDTVERENIAELAEMMLFYFMGNNESLVQEYIDPDFYINAEVQKEDFAFPEYARIYKIMNEIQNDQHKVTKEEVPA